MKTIAYTPMVVVLIALASCNSKQNQTTANDSLTSDNPFYSASTLPYHAPAGDKIKNGDYKPAMEAGRKQQVAER